MMTVDLDGCLTDVYWSTTISHVGGLLFLLPAKWRRFLLNPDCNSRSYKCKSQLMQERYNRARFFVHGQMISLHNATPTFDHNGKDKRSVFTMTFALQILYIIFAMANKGTLHTNDKALTSLFLIMSRRNWARKWFFRWKYVRSRVELWNILERSEKTMSQKS